MLIYFGLLAMAVSLFIPAEHAMLGCSLMVIGGLAAAAGVLLIVLRSRMKN